jgi:crossover junction endodeoxyribonuclease RusA
MTINLMLPWPPSVNHYWRAVTMPSKKGGPPVVRHLISKAGRDYKTAVAAVVAGSNAGQRMSGRLAIRIELYPPDKRQRDIDNSIKATLDALVAAGVFEDDSQVDHLEVVRADVAKGGAAIVTVTGER